MVAAAAAPRGRARPGRQRRRRGRGKLGGTDDERSSQAPVRSGPLWVVVGDATGQGRDAPSGRGGYVGRVLERLWADDPTWRVVNLSRPGATSADVLDDQLPRLEQLAQPSLVSCTVGANDVRRWWRRGLADRLRDIGWHLPAGSVVSTLPHGIKDRRASAVNQVIREVAEHHALVVADLWAHTGPDAGPDAGDDDAGAWAVAFLEALDLAG